MKGRIPEHILEDILGRVDIVELISGYFPLKRAGRNFKANCPFHHEKTPSFMVSPDRQIYHCFGCHESGNAFKFLMRYERMDFPEAVEALAKKAGVELPENSGQERASTNLNTQLFSVNECAALFYAHCLTLPAAEGAREYLLKRGVTSQTLQVFCIGYAPDTWDALISHSRQTGISLGLLEKAGLTLSRDAGGYYDRFRKRIIFPIVDIKARPLGFGARVLDASLPKYINSPETAIYTKGKNLYGLHLAKECIRELDFVIVVEGYLDLIMPFQAGVKNIVASLGTALTDEQARLIKRHTHNVVMVYDADKAGELATLRSLDIFVEQEMSVKVASLPKGLDPDACVRKEGVAGFRKRISEAKGLFEYKLACVKSSFDARTAEGKAKIAESMLETILKVKNAVLRSEYLKRLAQELDINFDALWQQAQNVKTEKTFSREQIPAYTQGLQVSSTEKLLLKLMLEEHTLIERLRGDISPDDFQDSRTSKVVSLLFDLVQQGKHIEPQFLMEHLPEQDVSELVCEALFLPEDLTHEHKEKVIQDCVQRLKQEKRKALKQHLHSRIKTAQAQGDQVELDRLVEEFQGLIKKR